MSQAIRVLHLEDSAVDADLIGRRLSEAYPGSDITWVEDREGYEKCLAGARFDVILCDYNLQGYDGLAALRKAQEMQPGVPIIMVTGTLDEDQAVECVRAAATDYVLKSRLQRLAPAVARALRESLEQRERQQAEDALRQSERRLQLALEASEVSVWEFDIESGHVAFSRELGPFLGYGPSEVPARIDTWEALVHPDDVKRLRVALARHYRGETPRLEIEYRI